MKYKHIFWDWNGTLFDDAQASCDAVNAMLRSRKLPLITFEQYREYIDVPIIRFYEKVMDVTKESMDALSVEFNAYVKKYLPQVPVSKQVRDVLKSLSNAGCRQYIFSSSQNKLILPYLEEFGLLDYFDSILGATDCYVGSKIERTTNYLKENAIPPADAVFIGDMAHDYDVAARIGSDCILISSGHQSESTLIKTRSKVVDSIALVNSLLLNL